MLAYNYVDMMYACSLFVTHTDIIILSTPFGGWTLTIPNGTSEVVFSQHIPPLCMRRVPPGSWCSCPRLGLREVSLAGASLGAKRVELVTACPGAWP